MKYPAYVNPKPRDVTVTETSPDHGTITVWVSRWEFPRSDHFACLIRGIERIDWPGGTVFVGGD